MSNIIEAKPKEILDKYCPMIVYQNAVFEKDGVSQVNSRKKYRYRPEKYTGKEVLMIPPKNCIRLEFEDEPSKNNRYIQELEDAASAIGLQYCITAHEGCKSPYFNIFNIEGLPVNEDNNLAKELLIDTILPPGAKQYLDRTNYKWTLSPVIGHPHWKKKYKGAIHNIIAGIHPLYQKNKYPKELLKKIDKIKKYYKKEHNRLKNDEPWVEDFLLDYCVNNALPAGDRHFVIEKNMAALIVDRANKNEIIARYIETQQGRNHNTLKTWFDAIRHGKFTQVNASELKKYINDYDIHFNIPDFKHIKDPNNPNIPNQPNQPNNPNLIRHYLEKKKRPYQSIGRGINNDVCYTATYIEDDDGKKRDAVVTSDKQIYIDYKKDNNEIRDDFDLNYREPFYPDVLDTCWSNESIKKWLFTDYSVDIRDLYNRFIELNKKFIIYEDNRIHTMLGIDVLRSFFFFLFNANSRTHFLAEGGSGKTNQLMIFRALMFNPIGSPDFSSASIYRIIEGSSGTILIDDFDDLPEEEKQRINRHAKVNYKRFKTIRSDGGKRFRPQGYDAFSHLVFNNIFGVADEITKQRVITYRMLKNKDAPDIDLDYRDPIFAPLRDDLYICLLQHWQQVKECYNQLKIPELKARDRENFKPQLAIAKLIGDDVYDEVLQYALNYVEQEGMVDLDTDWEYNLMDKLVDNLVNISDPKEEVELQVKNIANDIINDLYVNSDSEVRDKKKYQLNRFIGAKLTGYIVFPKTMPHNKAVYHVNKINLTKILYMKDWLHLFEDRLFTDEKEMLGMLGLLGLLPPKPQKSQTQLPEAKQGVAP